MREMEDRDMHAAFDRQPTAPHCLSNGGCSVHVTLTQKLEELVRRKVESGLYSNASEVVREALRLMVARDELDRLKLERLQMALIAGEQSGVVEDFSMDELMAQLDEEARAEALPDG
jgi:antitoxin ParD1/3/4